MHFENTRRLYVSDIDGTLLNSEGQLSTETKSVVQAFIASGGAFTLCTGRPTGTALAIAHELGIQLPILTYNGAMGYSMQQGRYIHHALLPPVSAVKLIVLVTSRAIVCVLYVLDSAGNTVLLHDNPKRPVMSRFVKDHLVYEHLLERIDGNLSLQADDSLIQLIAINSKASLTKLKQAVLDNFELKVFLVECFRDPGEWFLEVTSMQSTKGKGVQWLRDHLGASEVICFGDLSNDIPMFEVADYAVAMENANDRLKQLANAVTLCNNSHGVVRFLIDRYGDALRLLR